jgi:hypothetical protein
MFELVTGTSPEAADLVMRLPAVVDAQTFGERLHVTLQGANEQDVARFVEALNASPLRGVPVRRIPPSLEDVFIARLGSKERTYA